MKNRLATVAANVAWMAACRRDHARFRRALDDPAAAQRQVLDRLLQLNARCAYGRKYELEKVRDAKDFQQAAPLTFYDDLAPWIERIRAHGEQGVLTAEPVQMFEPTSGSTGASATACKFIPYTASLREEFQRAIRAWMFDLYLHNPGLLTGDAHWFVTPTGRKRERTPGGLPVGFETDADYLGPLERWLAEQIFAAPGAVAQIEDTETAIYVTLRFLFQTPSLAFISAWNPSLLTILWRRVRGGWARRLLDGLASGSLAGKGGFDMPAQVTRRLRAMPARARRLRALWPDLTARDLWPNLRLISCWTDAAAALALPELRAAFPGVPIQGKGLLATEGVVTIPLRERGEDGAALAVNSHFYEFLEDGDPARARLAHELETGGEYTVVITTGGGLWRYRLGDRVRVAGHIGRTPLLRFLGKDDGVSDLCGEKLSAAFVGAALAALLPGESAAFAMLAPVRGASWRYGLFVQPRADLPPDLAARLDAKLRANPHYDHCRRLGQLDAPDVFRILRHAQEMYLQRCEALGQRAGNIKPTPLHRSDEWERYFEI